MGEYVDPFGEAPDAPEPEPTQQGPTQQGPKRTPGPNDGMIDADREQRPMTEEEEQALRDFYGYAPTEKRTKAERDSQAAAILAKQGHLDDRPLPDDIEAVWGQGRLDSNGALAENTARYLIREWGLERFRASALHRAAIQDQAHSRARADARSDFRNRDLKQQK